MAACTRRHADQADQDREYRPFAQSPLLQFGQQLPLVRHRHHFFPGKTQHTHIGRRKRLMQQRSHAFHSHITYLSLRSYQGNKISQENLPPQQAATPAIYVFYLSAFTYLLAYQLAPTVSQVLQKLKRMLAKRATAPLDLHIKEFAMELAAPLTSIVNASLQRPNGRPRISPPSGKFPSLACTGIRKCPIPWMGDSFQQAVRVQGQVSSLLQLIWESPWDLEWAPCASSS